MLTDHVSDVHLFRSAADRGHVTSRCGLGYCYALGRGVPQDGQEG